MLILLALAREFKAPPSPHDTHVIVIGDEGLDLGFEIAWEVVILEQDPVLEV
jgi:hypothetical protein